MITKEARKRMGWRKGLIFTKITKTCEVCGKPFETVPSSSKQHCCSPKCMGIRRRKWPREQICMFCKKKFMARRADIRFCSKKCASRKRWHNHIPKIRDCDVIPRHKMKQCARCGFNKYPQILERHHIDRNRSNNAINNLEILCPNCHDIEHLLAHDGRLPFQLR